MGIPQELCGKSLWTGKGSKTCFNRSYGGTFDTWESVKEWMKVQVNEILGGTGKTWKYLNKCWNDETCKKYVGKIYRTSNSDPECFHILISVSEAPTNGDPTRIVWKVLTAYPLLKKYCV